MKLPDFISEYSALFRAIRKVVPPSMKIYLVGGAVRDIILGRKIRDFDFTVEGLVRPIGKSIAHELNGAYYVLDDEREMVRVIIEDEQMGKFDIDIAQLDGDSIEDDLRERDFAFNAMAISISDDPVLIDPLGGLDDLNNKRLRMCNPNSIKQDPMRAVRAIRMMLEFDLELDEELTSAMYEAPEDLQKSSMERYRDELFKIIRIYRNSQAVKEYIKFRYLDHLLPGWAYVHPEQGVQMIENTDHFSLMISDSDQQPLPDDYARFAASRLGNYQEAIKEYFHKSLALYHDRQMLTVFTAVAETFSDDDQVIKNWCSRLTFSGSEINFVTRTTLAHRFLNSISNLSSFGDVDIYRYFRKYKESGLAGLILFLAEGYSLQDVPNAYKMWCDKVVLAQDLISAYFTRYFEVIDPRPYMSGNDVQDMLGVSAGPIIGYIKNALIEAQIRGAVKNISEAELFVRQEAKHYR